MARHTLRAVGPYTVQENSRSLDSLLHLSAGFQLLECESLILTKISGQYEIDSIKGTESSTLFLCAMLGVPADMTIEVHPCS